MPLKKFTQIRGSEPVVVQQQEAGQVINFMEALKQSVAAASKADAKRPARKTASRRRKAKSA